MVDGNGFRLNEKFSVVMRGLCAFLKILPLENVIRNPGKLIKTAKLCYHVSQTTFDVPEFHQYNSRTIRLVTFPVDEGYFTITVTYSTNFSNILHRTSIVDSVKDNYHRHQREKSKSQVPMGIQIRTIPKPSSEKKKRVLPKTKLEHAKTISSRPTLQKKILPTINEQKSPRIPIPRWSQLKNNYHTDEDNFKMDTPTSSTFQFETSSSNSLELGGIKFSFSPFRESQMPSPSTESSPSPSPIKYSLRLSNDYKDKETQEHFTKVETFVQTITTGSQLDEMYSTYVSLDPYVNTLEALMGTRK